jgi:hypothetical protein
MPPVRQEGDLECQNKISVIIGSVDPRSWFLAVHASEDETISVIGCIFGAPREKHVEIQSGWRRTRPP